MSALHDAAWRTMGQAEHRCASCRRRCRACAEGEPCAQARWCTFCEGAYALNPPAEDGYVYCGGPVESGAGCGRYLPALAQLIERGLTQYPRYCGECRDAAPEPPPDGPVRPAPAAGDGPASAPGVRGRASEREPPSPTPEPVAPQSNPAAWHLRGGFVPRTPTPPRQPDVHSEMGDGETAHPRDAYC